MSHGAITMPFRVYRHVPILSTILCDICTSRVKYNGDRFGRVSQSEFTMTHAPTTEATDFEVPNLSFDAVVDRESGKHPFGVRQVVLDDMFKGFAAATVEFFVRCMHTLGFGK